MEGNNSSEASREIEKLPFWTNVFALVLYTVLFLMAIIGNAIALVILRTKQELRTLTHAFLTNLVVADLLLALLTPFEATSTFTRSYRFTDAGCKLQRVLLYFFYAASILTLSAISLERFIAICHAMKYDTFRAYKTRIIVLIWLGSFAIISPHIYLSERREVENGASVCFQFFTRDSDRVPFFWGYALPCFFLLYLLPLTLVSVTYIKVGGELKEMEQRLTKTSQIDLTATTRTRKEVLKMLLVVVVLFAIQWTPFEIVEILITAPRRVIEVDPIGYVRVTVNIIAFSNAVLNPIVFGYMSQPFRDGFKEAGLYLLKCACFPRCSPETQSTANVGKRNIAACFDNATTSTQCDTTVNWETSFERLGNPLSIKEDKVPVNETEEEKDGAITMDHKF